MLRFPALLSWGCVIGCITGIVKKGASPSTTSSSNSFAWSWMASAASLGTEAHLKSDACELYLTLKDMISAARSTSGGDTMGTGQWAVTTTFESVLTWN